MQNKCGSCNQQGFVPVTGSWDFIGADRDCNRRRNESGGQKRSGCQAEPVRSRERAAGCCAQTASVRESGCCEAPKEYSNCTGARECACEACTRRRARNEKNCACTEKAAYETDCGCPEETDFCHAGSMQEQEAGSGRGKNRHVGMVKGYRQELDEIFRSESALRAGTLFPELHKPLNGYCPCGDYCGTSAQEAAFAVWELRLYLNTHPHDERALALFRKLCKEAKEENYATAFLTDECCSGSWNWVRNPWPWEYDCQCGD